MEKNGISDKFLIWVPLFVVILALVSGMALRSGVDTVAEDSTEMVQTTVYLDSPASLKTIIVTLNRQFVRAENEWMQTLSILTFLLFLVSVIALIMWGRLHHLWRQDRERQLASEDLSEND